MRFTHLILISLFFIGLAILGLFGAVVLRPQEIVSKNQSDNKNLDLQIKEPSITFIDPMKGAREAKLTIVEFADFACPFCKEAHTILNQVLAAYPNDVRLVWKDFPITNLHPQAMPAAMAARCAGEQGKFWGYHDLLFATQENFNTQTFENLAQTLNLNKEKFSTCLSEEKTKPLVTRGLEEGEALKIDGVPYLFINGERYSAMPTFEAFEEIVKAKLDSQ